MTRLFNLESYSQVCTHANLYETEISSPLAYKNFLDRYRQHGYRKDLGELKELTVRDELIPLKHLGVSLSENGSNLYIVDDRIDSLSLGNLLKPGEKYLYRSVYHYWNYRQQITNNLSLDNPVVFIDLNSLSDKPYCSLQFGQYRNSPYSIPIIDNRRIANNEFKLSLNIKKIHHQIYRDLAGEILSRNFPQLATKSNTVEHLESYLQKIEVFKLAQSQSESANFTIIVEIIEESKIYYKSININIDILENIVTERIDFSTIYRFIHKYSEYSFVLISDYNFLPKLRELAKSSNIFLPKNHLREFPQIWHQKEQQNFPLFGQYLDKIKFQIKRNGKPQWIEVLSTEEQEHIYYEGEQRNRQFIARIQETGQDYFKLLYPDTVLPIQINDCDYCINGITQEYQILHPLSELEALIEELQVRIEFIIDLGSVPKLKVTDRENKYEIEARLQDYVEIELSLNCIPLNTILEYREQQFKNKVPPSEICDRIGVSLSSITAVSTLESLLQINKRIKNALLPIKTYKRNNRIDLLIYVASERNCLTALKDSLNKFSKSGVFGLIEKYCNNEIVVHKSQIGDINKVISNVLNLIGKTYLLSELYLPNFFFSKQFIKNAVRVIGVQYFSFLAKVAFNKNYQTTYFQIFNLRFSKNNKPCYQIKDYLWGYSRILLWYSKYYYQYQTNELDYLKHFKSITNYLLDPQMVAGNGQSRAYQQDAFLALIYLLTFRETDSDFCTKDSEEYQLAEEVIDKYKQSLVHLKAFPDSSLNECFEELLNGNSSQESVRRIIEAE